MAWHRLLSRKDRKSWIWFFSIVVGFIFMIGLLSARMAQVRREAVTSTSDHGEPPVVVMKVRPGAVWKTIGVLARVDTGQTLDIFADVGGWVAKRPVRIGERVRRGTPVMVLRDERKDIALREARARLAAARATLADLQRRLEKTRRLTQAGILSQDALDSLTHQVEAQQATVDGLQAARDRAEWDVEHLVIRAPIDGRVVDIFPDVGQEVFPGQKVLSMISTGVRRVKAGLDAQWARVLKPGLKVTLVSREGSRVVRRSARLTGVSPDIDRASGTYTIEAEIDDSHPDGDPWLSGEVVYMRIPVEKLDHMVRIPRTAVLSDNAGAFIFIFKDGKALQVPVEVTWLNEEEGAIRAEFIPQGAAVIVEGQVGLADGQKVRVVKTVTMKSSTPSGK